MVDDPREKTHQRLREHPQTLDDREGSQLVGIDDDGGVHYYDPVEKRLAKGDPEDGEVKPRWREGHEGSLDDVVQKVQDAVGWDALTDYAEDALGGDDDN